MRVGIETTFSAVSNSSTTVTAYYDVWTQNDLTWGGDAQQFDFDGNFDGAETYNFQNNGDDPETKMRVTKSYKYTYSSTSYGSSPANADFGAEVNNTYNGMNPTTVVHVPIPARPYGAPVAPDTCVVTRTSDTNNKVVWQNNATTGKPYSALWLERFIYGYASWTRIATSVGATTTYADTGAVANRKYAYRVQADNTIATSGYAQSGDIYTTPAAPTTPVRTQSGTDQVLTWALAVGYTEYATEIWRAVDGVYSLLATVATGVTTYTDTTSSSATKVKYKFRTKTTVGTQLYSADSAETTETAGVLTAPSAPTLLVPSTGTLDPTEAIAHTWRHNPTDGTAQTAFQVQYRYVGDSTWIQTGKITGTASSWTMPANTRDKGRQVEWQVQTWGGSATASPFSATATWTTSPIIAVKYPLFLDLTSGRTEADSTAIKAQVSGVWATMAQYVGVSQDAGQMVYLDSVGNLRTEPEILQVDNAAALWPASKTINNYPFGISSLGVGATGGSAGGWPSSGGSFSGNVLTHRRWDTAGGSGWQIWAPTAYTAGKLLIRYGQDTGWSAWRELTSDDTGWVTGGTGATVIAADPTNFTLGASWARKIGNRVEMNFYGTMKVASSTPTSGDIGNLTLGTVATAWRVNPASGGPLAQTLGPGHAGRVVGCYIATSNSVITLGSIGGNTAVGIGDTISVTGTYVTD
jgi:hypothetical protein